MNRTEQHKKLRAVLSGSKCLSPASVHDPLSARVAQSVGYETGVLAGSLVSPTTLAAPDFALHTITEYADQIRRITRVSSLSLFAEADNGYGNALSVMRTVQELEHAGVSGLSIDDTPGQIQFGQTDGEQRLVSIPEAVGKMRAAVAARGDPALVIAARTPALKVEGLEGTIARARAYAAAGVDAIFLSGVEKLEQIQAVHAAAKLPIIVGRGYDFLHRREELAACGARIIVHGHQPIVAAVRAYQETYAHLFNGGTPADLKSKIASPGDMEQLVNAENYKQWLNEYMR